MRILVLLLAIILNQPVIAYPITGKVVSVTDGDTLTVLDADKKQHKIRLHQIDAPEKRQAFGQRSRQSLADLVFGKQVTVEVVTKDRYGREVGRVLVDGKDVGLEQIKRGMAWVYRQYAIDPAYFAAEASAKRSRLGLWAQPDPTPPWEWRHSRKSAGVRASMPVIPLAGGSCGSKRTCSQMASCKEAMHYLRDCGLSRLDSDKDGIPCKSLCRR